MTAGKREAAKEAQYSNREETVTLTALAYGGDAIGRLQDNSTVFVPFGLPGEIVRVSVQEEKKKFARGKIIELLKPSPERVDPRCPHFGECGGCHFQHLSYSGQAHAKEDIVRQQLQRIGRIENPPVLPLVKAPTPWNYRNTIQLHLSREGQPGFQAAGSNSIIPIRECHLPAAAINEIWPLLDLAPEAGITRIELRSNTAGDVLLVLQTEGNEVPEMVLDLDVSVVHSSRQGETLLAGDPGLVMEVLGKPFYVSAGSFFQVNTQQAEAMVSTLLEKLHIQPADTVLDLYCGVGLFSLFLAPLAGRVIGVESSPSACQDYAVNLDAFDHVELYEGGAEMVLPLLDAHPRVAVVDPPRAGMDRRALDALVSLQPEQIAYVSCDPSTLARDLNLLLKEGYSLQEVIPFDLFPQTYHVETVVIMSRV